MEEFKKQIAKNIINAIDTNITIDEIIDKIEVPKDSKNGDFAYPCFNLAKLLKDSPVNIANNIKDKIILNDNTLKLEVVDGYLNFYLNSNQISCDVLKKIILDSDKLGESNIGNGKNIVIDYSSPNIAKPFHLGHFRNTVLGSAIYNLYKALGYNVIGINYLGDWGRQFGLLIEAYNRFKDEYDIENDPLKALSDMYVKISKLAKEDESVMDKARENFKALEDGNEKYLKLWQYFREISLKEYNRIYEILGCKFDSYNGEAFYNDKMGEVIQTLDAKGVLKESEGAKIVEFEDNTPPCIILKSNGSTIYATRDLASILYRVRNYDFTKAIYITGYDQNLHFKQVFQVAKYLIDEKYRDGLVHVAYGMVRLKTGKMSTREGSVIYINDLLDEAITKAYNIIENKNSELENKDETAKQVGIGALVFNYLKNNKIKDIIFDLDESLKFDGETGPYIQYTYVRSQSILNKAKFNIQSIDINKVKLELLKDDLELNVIKLLDSYYDIILRAANSYEPAILARYLIDVATSFSKFYNNCQVITDDIELQNARCVLVLAVSFIIKKGLLILGIKCPDKM
ncbi:MAG: arginine--tRNA ligase [Clostridia bacterium]